MKKFLGFLIILSIFIGGPLLAEFLSNIISTGLITKCIYLTSGLFLIHLIKEIIK